MLVQEVPGVLEAIKIHNILFCLEIAMFREESLILIDKDDFDKNNILLIFIFYYYEKFNKIFFDLFIFFLANFHSLKSTFDQLIILGEFNQCFPCPNFKMM